MEQVQVGLTKCEECGGEVSTMAAVCPHCGYQIQLQRSARWWGKVIYTALVVVGIWLALALFRHQ